MLSDLFNIDLSGAPSILVTVGVLFFVGFIFQFFVLARLRENKDMQERLRKYEDDTSQRLSQFLLQISALIEADKSSKIVFGELADKILRVENKLSKLYELDSKMTEQKSAIHDLHVLIGEKVKDSASEFSRVHSKLIEMRETGTERFSELNKLIYDFSQREHMDFVNMDKMLADIDRAIDSIKEKQILQSATIANLGSYSAVGLK